MSSAISSPVRVDVPSSSRAAVFTATILREPLLHFVLLGALLFGIDHWRASQTADPHLIVVGADVDREASSVFERSRGRPPTAEEREALRRVWLDNEVLYREGVALQVDKGDPAIRERVIFKALSIVDASVRLPEVSETELRAWFEQHRDRYDAPARYDFQDAVLPGASGEAEVRAFVAALNAGTPGDARAGLRVYKGRPHATVVQSFGAGFAQELEAGPVGEWRALHANDAWHAVRLEASTPAVPANFDSLHGVVRQDWTDATASALRSAAVREMARKYTIRYETAGAAK